MKKVFVLGSINTDLVMETYRMPLPGESVVGSGFVSNQGGKGANQAVACAKLGCECMFLGAVGNDSYGKKLVESLQQFDVDTSGVQIVKKNSGTCVIILDKEKNDNYLVVDLGANLCVNDKSIIKFLTENAKEGDIFLTQLEVNLNAVETAVKTAKQLGMFVTLNPAPAAKIGGEILDFVDLIVPNETEAFTLTGIKPETEADVLKIYSFFQKYHIKELLITLGKRGSVYVCQGRTVWHEAHCVNAVDTTSAGDTFIGAICVQLCKGFAMSEAIGYATACSAITVSRKGAALSIPTQQEVEEYLKNTKGR